MNPRDTETPTPSDTLRTRDVDAPSETAMADAIAAAAVHREQPPATGRTLTVDDLQAYYGDNHAVRDISLTYAANRVTAMIGPSGCGKSTVLRCLNRMHEEIPNARAEGTVMLDDIDIYDSKVDVVAVRRAIGMVFQKPNPFPTMSIFDNVAAGLRLAGIKGVDTEQRVEESLRGAGLW
jgi:phosphate transport system ATP-binding protein